MIKRPEYLSKLNSWSENQIIIVLSAVWENFPDCVNQAVIRQCNDWGWLVKILYWIAEKLLKIRQTDKDEQLQGVKLLILKVVTQ